MSSNTLQIETVIATINRFKSLNGHCYVPTTYVVDGTAFGHTVSYLRKKKKAGTLAADWVEQLNAVGFVWEIWPIDMHRFFQHHGHSLEQFIAAIVDFKEKNGHCWIPMTATIGDMPIGRTAAYLRKRKREGTLDPDLLDRLNALGFAWGRHDPGFELGLTKLQEFYARHGHTFVPTNEIADGFELGSWCSNIRNRFAKGLLSQDRIDRLVELKFRWQTQDKQTADWEGNELARLPDFNKRKAVDLREAPVKAVSELSPKARTGERHGRAKLGESDVIAIRKWAVECLDRGQTPPWGLKAAEMGVSEGSLRDIAHRRTWKTVA